MSFCTFVCTYISIYIVYVRFMKQYLKNKIHEPRLHYLLDLPRTLHKSENLSKTDPVQENFLRFRRSFLVKFYRILRKFH